MTSSRLPVPCAVVDERSAAVIAAESPAGAKLAAGRLSGVDFWDDSCRRVFEVAIAERPRLAAVQAAAPIGSKMETRLAEVAGVAGVPVGRLLEWRDAAPTAIDANGTVARRVRTAALLRGVMVHAADGHAAAARQDPERARDELEAAMALLDELERLGGPRAVNADAA